MKIDQQKAELLMEIHRKCAETYLFPQPKQEFYLVLVEDTVSILLNTENRSIQEAYDPTQRREVIWIFTDMGEREYIAERDWVHAREMFYKQTIQQVCRYKGGIERVYTAFFYTSEMDVEIEKPSSKEEEQ